MAISIATEEQRDVRLYGVFHFQFGDFRGGKDTYDDKC